MSKIPLESMEPNKLTGTDLTPQEIDKVKEFIEGGMSSIHRVDEQALTKIMSMYLEGLSYDKISNLSRLDKSVIMYLSYKFNWFAMRQDYLIQLERNIRKRLIEARLISQDFLLQLSQVWEKKIGKQISEYQATGDDACLKDIDLKEVDRYLKTIERLDKLSITEGVPKRSSPTVSLNLGDGATITKKDDNSLEITPKQKTIGEMLAFYADQRRAEELSKESDIKKKDTNQGDKE